jgi:DNA-binding NtrC family response regulator
MIRGPVVILVDDDVDVLAAIRRSVRDLAIDLRTTSDVHEALAWLEAEDVAVVIADYKMPQMNGVELIAEVRRRSPSTVRVLMTGRHALETAVDGINRGAIFRYMQKPFNAQQMCSMVHDAISHHRELIAGAVVRIRAAKRAELYAELELDHPGIADISRDDDGAYVVPEVCDVEAIGMLGLSLARTW